MLVRLCLRRSAFLIRRYEELGRTKMSVCAYMGVFNVLYL